MSDASSSGQPLAEATTLWLRVATPERVQFETGVRWVQVPTEGGVLGIWPLHAPLVDIIVPGHLEFEARDGIHREWIGGGILYVRQGQVIILTGGSAEVTGTEGEGLDMWEQSVQAAEEVLGFFDATEQDSGTTASI